MRPGQLEPNDFEMAILRRMAVSEPWLAKCLDHLHVLSREFTGVGCFTNFKSVGDLGPRERLVGLRGFIKMPGVPHGLFATLFCQDTDPVCLEIASCGDDLWDGVYDGFTFDETA